MARNGSEGKKVGRAFGQTYFEGVSNQFFFRVAQRRLDIEENLADKFAPFFRDMRSFVGLEGTPNPVRRTGVRWKPLTQKWRDQKFKKRNQRTKSVVGTPEQNRFYRGIKGGVFRSLGKPDLQDANDVYGAPEVFIKTKSRRYLNKAQMARLEEGSQAPLVDRRDIDWDGKTLRYRGSFANINKLFEIQLGFRMTPEINDEEDYYDPFSARTAMILGANDMGDAAEPRPFLKPMLDYYQDVVLPNEFIRSAYE